MALIVRELLAPVMARTLAAPPAAIVAELADAFYPLLLAHRRVQKRTHVRKQRVTYASPA